MREINMLFNRTVTKKWKYLSLIKIIWFVIRNIFLKMNIFDSLHSKRNYIYIIIYICYMFGLFFVSYLYLKIFLKRLQNFIRIHFWNNYLHSDVRFSWFSFWKKYEHSFNYFEYNFKMWFQILIEFFWSQQGITT